MSDGPTPPDPLRGKAPEGSGRAGWIAICVGLALTAVFTAIGVKRAFDAPVAPAEAPPADSASLPAEASVPPPGIRCAEVAPGASFVIGDLPAARPVVVDAGAPDPAAPPPEAPEDDLAPFAVELGPAAAYEGGFAAGTLREAEGGNVAMVAFVDREGRSGKLVRLARSRGDMEPPVVAPDGKAVLAAMHEPNAGGRAIKLARIEGEAVTWGPELSEGRDDSLALDLAAGARRAVVTWDDVSPDGKRAVVQLASFDAAAMRPASTARPVSRPDVDADSPRVVARPGGFWLAYVAHAEVIADKGGAKKKDAGKPESEEVAEERGGEAIARAWVEILQLDEEAGPAAAPRRVTLREGNVMAFDLEVDKDGAAVIAWRDDDTPSGSSGGVVSMIRVSESGPGDARVVADEGVGSGIPTLLPGWLAISDVAGPKRLAPVGPTGELLKPLESNATIGAAEPIAAAGGNLLIARPRGRAMELSVVKCEAIDP